MCYSGLGMFTASSRASTGDSVLLKPPLTVTSDLKKIWEALLLVLPNFPCWGPFPFVLALVFNEEEEQLTTVLYQLTKSETKPTSKLHAKGASVTQYHDES